MNPFRSTAHDFECELMIPLTASEYDAIVREAEEHRLSVGIVLRTWLCPLIPHHAAGAKPMNNTLDIRDISV